MNWNIPSAVSRALSLLRESGYEAYVVGGCVRDTLMGVTPNDWDIATSALPRQTMEVFSGYSVIETGIQHGTVTVLVDCVPLEITTYRVDGKYSDSRRPDAVSFTPSLEEDLRRRDFTINAMAYHPDNGLVDLFGGVDDIQNRRIVCVGDPDTRFSEDALRIIRGLRFASTLDFSIESETANAICRLYPTLSKVAAERVTEELVKLLCGKGAARVLIACADVFSGIFPCLSGLDAAPLIASVPSVPYARMAALLFPCAGEGVNAVFDNLRLPSRVKEDVKLVLSYRDALINQEDASLLRLLNKLGAERANVLLSIREKWDNCDYTVHRIRLNELYTSGACYTLQQLAVSGEDLIRAGMTAGPQIGETLQKLLFAVMDGVCENTKQDLLRYIN